MFSAAKYVLSENRRSVTPQRFEAIMILKFNSKFWDAPLFGEAIREARKERASGRYMAHEVRDDEKFDSEEEEQFRFFDGTDMKLRVVVALFPHEASTF